MARIYVTKQNDTVDLIAKQEYGEERGTGEIIYDANQHLFNYPTLLPEGVNVFLPDIINQQEDKVQTLWG